MRGRSTWAFWDRFKVPDLDTDETYLERIRIIATPWGGIYLHRFDLPDARATLHDHPWSFLSIVLKGGYTERRLDPITMEVDERHHVRFANRVRSHEAHSITRLRRIPTWTLVFVGKRVREWGYWERDFDTDTSGDPIPSRTDSWIWTPFYEHFHNTEFQYALERQKERA